MSTDDRGGTRGDGDGEERISFFIMPDIALKSLRDELRILLGERDAGAVLNRIGYRCGEGVALDLGEEAENIAAASRILPELWMHIGLSNIEVKQLDGPVLEVRLTNSVEVRHLPPSGRCECKFSAGYLKGLMETILGRAVECAERECRLAGADCCVFRIERADHDLTLTAESDSKTEQQHHLKEGMAYLLSDAQSRQCFDIFEDHVKHGMKGVCVTRSYPEKIRETYDLYRTPMIWLTKEEGGEAIKPHQLGKLNHLLEDLLRKNEEMIILIDGLEYLITHNNFQSVLKFVQILRDKIATTRSILLLPISPDTLDMKNLKLLQRETKEYSEDTAEEDLVETIFSKLQ